MAKAYNLTLQLNLQGPTNLKPIIGKMKRELESISKNTLDISINKQSLSSIDQATTRLRNMSKVLREASLSANTLNASLSKLNSSLNSSRSTSSATAQSLNKLGSSAASTSKQIQQANNSAIAFGKSLRGQIAKYVGFTAVNTAFSLTTRLLDEAVRAFIDYDRQLIRIQQVTNSSRGAIAGLNEEIRRLSVSLGTSSSELVQVSVTLAQTGLSAREVQTAIKSIATASLAPTFTDMKQTAEGAIAAFNQFGIAANQLETVLDSINAVASRFAVEADDIIGAIQRTGGVFAAASKGVAEGTDALNQFIAVFTSVRATTRESSETIATGLKTITTRLQRLDTITSLQDLLGISLLNQGEFVGVFEAISRISEAIERLGLSSRDVRFSQLVEDLGGVRQVGKVIPLLQEFSKAQEAYNVAQNSSGSISKDAEKAQASIAVQLIRTREAWDDLIASFADNSVLKFLTKTFLTLTRSIFGFLQSFSSFAPILAIVAGAKVAKFVGGVAKGFSGGVQQAGGASGLGQKLGQKITGAPSDDDKAKNAAQAKALDALVNNTTSMQSLIVSIDNLARKIDNLPLSGGKQQRILPFAKGGAVPGTGKGDKVPALLEPGEVVMSNAAVNKYGRGNLVRMNEGGSILEADAVGAAILKGNNQQTDSLNIPAKLISDSFKDKKDTNKKEKIEELLGSKNYELIKNPLSLKNLDGDKANKVIGFESAILKGLKAGVNIAVKNLSSLLGISSKGIASGSGENFVKSLNSAAVGNLFEQILTSIQGGGKWEDNPDKLAPFDFTEPFSGPLATLFPKIANLTYKDAKASYVAATKENFASKIGNQILRESGYEGSLSLNDIQAKALQNFKENPRSVFNRKTKSNQFLLEQKLIERRLVKETGGVEKLFTYLTKKGELALAESNKKAYGGIIEKFASGGTVPAMVSNGEAFVDPITAKKVGYDNLKKMNQADRNGMTGFSKGGISIFKGPGSGTSDSIGPIGLPNGGFVIREKATKALKLREGGVAGKVKSFFGLGGNNSSSNNKNVSVVLDANAIQVQLDSAAIADAIESQLKDIVINVKQAATNAQNKIQQASNTNAGKFGAIGNFLKDTKFGNRILGSKTATKLGGVSDFLSGKGSSSLSKGLGGLLKLGGRFPGGLNALGIAAGTGLEFAQQNFLTEEQKKDPTTRGVFAGAKGGIAGALTGFAVGGPIGAAVFGFVGALKSARDEIQKAKVDKAFLAIEKSTISLDKSFQELDAGIAGASDRVNRDAGNILASQKELITASEAGTFGENFGKNIIGSILTLGALPYFQSNAGAEQARQGLVDQASTLQQTAERKAVFDLGRVSEEELRAANGNAIQRQYAEFIASAEGGLANVTAARRAEIEATASARAALDAYRIKRQQEGADSNQIAREIDQNRALALRTGKEELDRRNELIQKQALQARATKEVALAVAAQADVYARLSANLQKAADATDFLISKVDNYINLTQGAEVDRRNEQVLGNLLAYSPQEVQRASAPIASALGGTEQATNLAANARIAKVLQEDLPARLRGAQTREDRIAIIDDLRAQFSNLGISTTASDAVLKDIARTIEENQDVGTLLEEIDNNIISQFSSVVQQGQQALQNAVKAYNDSLQKLIDQHNKYNQTLAKAREYVTKAGVTRLEAENRLAEALGRNVSLEKLNASIDLQIRSLTSGLVDRGAITADQATDPTAIGQGIKQLRESNEALIRKNEEIRQVQSQLGSEPAQQQLSQELDEQYRDNLESIAANNQALRDSRAALENMANTTAKADNALKKLQDSQREVAGGADFLTRVLTNAPEENFNMMRQMGAFQAMMAGDQNVAMSRLGRQDAFAGLDIFKSLGLSDAEYSAARADLLEKQLTAQGVDMNKQITFGENKFTIKELLDRMRNPEDSPEVKAYKEATKETIAANMALADLEYQNAEMIAQSIETLENYFRTEFPNALKDAIKGAEDAGQRQKASGAELRRQAESQLDTANRDLASLEQRRQEMLQRRSRGFRNQDEAEAYNADARKFNQEKRDALDRKKRAETDIGIASAIERADEVERKRKEAEAAASARGLLNDSAAGSPSASYRQRRQAGATSATLAGLPDDPYNRDFNRRTQTGATSDDARVPRLGPTGAIPPNDRASRLESQLVARGIDMNQQLTVGEDRFTIRELLDRMRNTNQTSPNNETVAVTSPSLDSLQQMALSATQPGSIYTHDIHSEDVLKQIFSVLSNNFGAQGVANGVTERQLSNTTIAQTTISEESLTRLAQFNQNFSTYVDKLVNFKFPTIPETIQLNGTHVVEVRFTGAAALSQLEGSMQNLVINETNKAMSEIWDQSFGKLGRRPTPIA